MTKKLIVTTLIITSFTHANSDPTANDAKSNTAVWNPTITNIKSGDSCDDGNCFDDIDCFTKEGPMYKAMRSVRKSVKKLCDKL